MILVTGAAGTVGSEVAKALSARGVKFRAGYRSRPDAVRGLGGDTVHVDFAKPETVTEALAGISTVFLLSNDVAPEAAVVSAAKAAGVKRIVKLSVWGAEEEAFSFAKWHRPVERAIEASGLAWTFLRPNGFMQNVVNFMGATIKGQNAIYQPAGDARISHIDARDIGAVAARVLTETGHDGRAYTLSGPRGLSYGDIAAILSSTLGRTIQYVSITDEAYKQGAMAAGIPEGYADALVDLVRYYRTGAASAATPDVEQVTGKNPSPFERFVEDYASALR